MLVIGIEPGITGSICFFEDGKVIDLNEMPNMADGKKRKKQSLTYIKSNKLDALYLKTD